MATNFFFPELHVGPHQTEDGSVVDERSSLFKNYTQTMRKWLLGAHDEAEFDTKQDHDVRKAQAYISYIIGNQWPSKRPSYRSSPVDNRVWGLVWELVALLTDLRPVGLVKSTWPDEFLDSESMLNKATRAWWLESHSDQALALAIVYAILGTGFGKLQWNPALRNGSGDFELVPIGPLNCLCLKPENTDIQSSQAVIYEQVWPLSKFREKFGSRGAMVRADASLSRYMIPGKAPSSMSPTQFAALAPQMQRLVGTPERYVSSTYPRSRYREFWFKDCTLNTSGRKVLIGEPGTNWSYWVRPGQPLYPRGRMVALGGDGSTAVIMRDGPNPYWHGSYPFDALRLNIVPWQFFGLSDLRPLIPLQDIVNNILAGVLDMVKKAVNPLFVAPRNALSEAGWDALDTSKPGAKVGLNPLASQAPTFTNPPNLPAWVMTTMMLAGREMDRSSGISAVSEAVQKRQIPSGDTLEQIKEVQQTPIRLKGRNIETFLERIGRMNISNIFQFYSEKRRMFLSGKPNGNPDESLQTFDWPGSAQAAPKLKSANEPISQDAAEYARQFIYVIHPDSLLSINQVEKSLTMMRLRMMGDISRRKLYETLDLGINVDEVEEELKQEALQKADILADQRTLMAIKQMLGQAALAGAGASPAAAAPTQQ